MMKVKVKWMNGRIHSFCGINIYKDNAEYGARWVVPEFYLEDFTAFNGNDCSVNITHDADIEISLVLDDENRPMYKKIIEVYKGNLLNNKQFCSLLKSRLNC